MDPKESSYTQYRQRGGGGQGVSVIDLCSQEHESSLLNKLMHQQEIWMFTSEEISAETLLELEWKNIRRLSGFQLPAITRVLSILSPLLKK